MKSRRNKHRKQDRRTSGFRDWYRGKLPVLRFCSILCGLMVLLYALLATPYCDQTLYGYLKGNAWLSSKLLNGLGQHTSLNGVTITSTTFSVAIQRGCDAVEPTWLLCAAILAYQARWTHRIIGMLIGATLLQILNVSRIVSLFWLGSHWPAFFSSAHVEIWPVFFIIVSVLLFMVWQGWTSGQRVSHAIQ